MKIQNYANYRLPITTNPLEYGKLIEQIGNIYIIQLNSISITANVLILQQNDRDNFIKFYRRGELVLEFKDHIIDESSFTRFIGNTKFTFVNGDLVRTEIVVQGRFITIFSNINYSDTDAINLKTNTPLKFSNSTISILQKYTNIIPKRSFSTSAINSAKHPGNIVKLRKIKSSHSWRQEIFNFNNKLFTTNLFETIINKFWSKIEHDFTGNNHMFILFKIKYNDGRYVTMNKLQRLNKTDKIWYFKWIIDNILFRGDYYKSTQIHSILLSYGFKKGLAPINKDLPENINFQKYVNMILPISYNPLDYGRLILSNKFEEYTQFVLLTNNGLNYKIEKIWKS